MGEELKILVTGGAGFIGSNFVRHLIEKHNDEIVVLDKLTYAGRLENLQDVMDKIEFVKGDICDHELVNTVCKDVNAIVNFAAETHVDRSIVDSSIFVRTDVIGTHTLLEISRRRDIEKYVQISTDEVYGSIAKGSFKENSPLNPSNPYSASKAGADMLVMSFFATHGLPVAITRSSNNYGPHQHPEKLIPKLIINALRNVSLPIYGKGMNVRDWLYVKDNCEAIDVVLRKGGKGEVYNIAGECEKTNVEVAKSVLRNLKQSEELITFVKDRPGHDLRYSLECGKLKELGWRVGTGFDVGLRDTMDWYSKNEWWWKNLVQ
jgi:dTDP-glucose 4,6-dehydratase